ncbi:MAG: response regulator [Candidatus Omnitrophica bacterium]|nr:response regulator [Candidatus Omnitrophota bacterium]
MDDINVYGDKRRIRQILLNLVSNAVKFTQEGNISIDIYNEDENEIKVAVSDTGIGLKKEDLDIIFERFRQADGSAKREYEGTGLGLAITKEMVELQGGRIWVESEEGKGTTFFFTIPRKPFVIDQEGTKKDRVQIDRTNRQQILKAVPEKISRTEKMKADKGNEETILVIDDEPINIEALSVSLIAHNYRVISAQDGVSGLKIMREKKPDVVILDVMMPGMDGFEFCEIVKKDETVKNIPIIFLTARVTRADKLRGFNTGADEYMVKPFDVEELMARMQVLLRRRSHVPKAKEKKKEVVSAEYKLKQDEEILKEEPRGRGEMILVIDDEPINIEVLDGRLTLNNYKVIAACDGVEGLRIAREKMPELIILDLMMPKMTGYEFCKAIKSDDRLKNIPLIMLSAKDAIVDKLYGYNLGADDYMTKPLNKTDLLIRVDALLRTKSLQNQLKQFAQRLSDLFGVGTTICSIFEITELYGIIANSAAHVLRANKCALLFFGENSFLSIVASVGIESKEARETKVNMGEAISGLVAQGKKPLLIADFMADKMLAERDREKYYTGSFLSVPLIEQGSAIGVLNVARDGTPFTNDDLQILLIFANQAIIAIGNAKLVNREKKLVKKMAETEIRTEYVDILQDKNKDLEEAYSQLQDTQEQLVQSEKMATIGILAGGVAHEINTPLGTILTNTGMLKSEMAADFQKECLDLIEKSTLRCKIIVEQLLNYSRKSKEFFDFLDIKEILDETCFLLKHNLSQNCVAIHKEYHDLPRIKGNANELAQVFTNIVMNAGDSIKDKFDHGKKEGNILIRNYQDGDYLVVEIKDNGSGIPVENISKIFDPFYTTKDVGKGTGLGLSVSYKIIENHGGKITVESRRGEGSTFKVSLPLPEGV